MLSARDVTWAYGQRTLLDGVDLSVDPGERVALVGENGAGKSTLLKLLAGRISPESGEVRALGNARVDLLAQEPDLDPEATVIEVVKSGLAELFALLQEHERLCAEGADGEAIAELTERIEDAGGFDVDHRVEEVLHRLSIRQREEKVKTLSGGERRRTDLARLLLAGSDVLLLDEPTNHLDRGAIAWLRDVLRAHRGAILFITHDRAFLDDVATRILELDRGELFKHDVPYANFIEGKLLRQDLEQKTADRRKRLLARELVWLKKSPKARTTKQNARVDRAQALMDDVKNDIQRQQSRQLELKRARAQRLAKQILELKALEVSRGDRKLVDGLDLILVEGERWGIIGDNGAGKTSLLKTLTGELEPSGGEVKRGLHTRFAVFDQHRSGLDPEATLDEVLAEGGDYVFVGDERVHVATYLERFLFSPSDRKRATRTLSGGEQNRLLLARMFKDGANVLILDEPTNDLDVTTLGVLEEALLEHAGVALIVSHDRAFLDRVCTGILAFEDGEVTAYQGDYTNYENLRAQAQAAAAESAPTPVVEKKTKNEKPREKKKRSYKEAREYETIEADVMAAEEARDTLLKELEAGGASDPARAVTLSEELAAAEAEVERLYARWEELEEIGG
jgi:ATP-binding cassette subfamily F protein uup